MKAIIENGKVNYEIQSCFIGRSNVAFMVPSPWLQNVLMVLAKL